MAPIISSASRTAIPGLDVDLSKGLGFADIRQKALHLHLDQGIPSTKHEEWKYTSLRAISEGQFAPAENASAVESDLKGLTFGQAPCRIVCVNGRFDDDLTSVLSGIAGLRVRTLGCALEHAPELLTKHFGAYADIERHSFAALNTAGFVDMLLIRIEAGAKIDQPLQLVFLTDTAKPVVAMPRVLIIAEQDSQAVIVETHASLGNGVSLTVPVVEASLESGAQLEHIKVQVENESAFHVAQTSVRQETNSRYDSYSVTFGGALTRNDLNVNLAGSHTHCRMDGIVILHGNQFADNHSRLDHAMPHCDSFEVYKHVLDDRSRAVFNGKIFVHQDAQKTDAKQTNQTLLLSREAAIDTKPQLEIFADDVKCTHGATVGQLREDAMFYLRARGIPLRQARAMLVYAFAAEVLERISVDSVREGLEAILFAKLDR